MIMHYPAWCAGYRCTCGSCKVIPTQRESVCCHEMEQMKRLLEDPHLEVNPFCVTQHTDFTHVCLCRTVFTASLYAHLHYYENVELLDDENRYVANHAIHLLYLMLFTLRKFRYLAYRQLTWWGWQHLGRHRRVILPSFAVAKIRQEFPSALEEYRDHQYPPATP